LDEVDIQTGFLMNGTSLRFGALIIPDIIATYKDTLLTLLGTAGLNAIAAYVNGGGYVYASSKGAWLLEQAGILVNGTVDTSIHLKILVLNFISPNFVHLR
jgi:hypothetical protein